MGLSLYLQLDETEPIEEADVVGHPVWVVAEVEVEAEGGEVEAEGGEDIWVFWGFELGLELCSDGAKYIDCVDDA